MTNNTNKNFFNVNFFDNEEKGIKANTISGPTANFKKASKGSGAAYEELCRLMKEHPTFTLEKVEPKKHIEGKKQSYDGMDFSFMTSYIETLSTATVDNAEYTKVKSYAEDTKHSVYPFMKKWFINKYGVADANGKKDKLGNVIKHFDMELAKAQISAFHQAKAKEYEAQKASATEAQVLPISA